MLKQIKRERVCKTERMGIGRQVESERERDGHGEMERE